MNAKGSVQFGTLQAGRPVGAFGTQEARLARIDRSLALWFNLAVESLDVTRG